MSAENPHDPAAYYDRLTVYMSRLRNNPNVVESRLVAGGRNRTYPFLEQISGPILEPIPEQILELTAEPIPESVPESIPGSESAPESDRN